MKLAGFLLLVTITFLSLEVQDLQAAVPPLKLLGACIEFCSSSLDCDPGERCVSNGCGHICAADLSTDEDLP
uniref:Putative secreted protein n=1 Tax=Desmodus rotundus TaxID=9430 RepID=K9IFU2_DESRO